MELKFHFYSFNLIQSTVNHRDVLYNTFYIIHEEFIDIVDISRKYVCNK